MGDEHIVVGRIKRPVGLKGEVEVHVESDEPTRFQPGSRLLGGPDRRPLRISRSRVHGERRIVAFEDVGDRTAAEALGGMELFVPTSEVRELPEGEFWDFELVGCEVVSPEGERLGEVVAVMHPPGSDMLVIEADGREHLVPLVRALVPHVDRGARRLTVDPIPGLLE
ncbi:MAG TPA: ribosome maturation factor RimM [Actinomycetota bacterium]|nr:ribosome maturation factor RimM [Actinomycetota bacterium]